MVFFRLVLYFTVFSFAGWVSETLICSFNEKKLVKRGFLTGPFIPVYGFGGLILVVLLSPLHGNPLLLYVAGVISVTIFEYFSGWLMETLFHIRLWDYSQHRFQLNGRIWLVSSLFFGVLGLAGVYLVQPPLEDLLNRFSTTTIYILGAGLAIYFLADTVNSVITVVSLNAKLQKVAQLIEMELHHVVVERKLRRETKANWSQRRLLAAYPNMTSKRGKGLVDFMRSQTKEAYAKGKSKIKELQEEHDDISGQLETLTKEAKDIIKEEKENKTEPVNREGL